jgi:Fic family protein
MRNWKNGKRISQKSPAGYSGLRRIKVAAWRDDANGPMRVVSGPLEYERVHYIAPPAAGLEGEMRKFFHWWAGESRDGDGIIRAAMAHLWFVAIHPFDDGNGRIARTLTEMALAQDENQVARYYSLSSIMRERDEYYRILARTSRGDGDLTEWLVWFMTCLSRAIDHSRELMSIVLEKDRFWRSHAGTELNKRQQKVVNRLLDAGRDGFEGGLTNRTYAGMAHVSRATAQRELADLVKKGILVRNPGGGRSVSYALAHFCEMRGSLKGIDTSIERDGDRF